MSSYASAGWQPGITRSCSPRGSRRALEIVGIVFAFFWFWPAAAAYIAWKVMGYPLPAEWRGWISRNLDFADARSRFRGAATPFSGTGNAAFDEYRRGEIERLEAERRKLDDEAREFRTFVDDLKRAKDREEFDAYMRKRRETGSQTALNQTVTVTR